MKKKELIFTIVNVGFADEVMEKARKCGVKGGTIIHGRGTAKKDAEQFFDISFSGEKEIVLMVIDSDIKDSVLKAIYDGVIPSSQTVPLLHPHTRIVFLPFPAVQHIPFSRFQC